MGLPFRYSVSRKEVTLMGKYISKKNGLLAIVLALVLLPLTAIFSLTKKYR